MLLSSREARFEIRLPRHTLGRLRKAARAANMTAPAFVKSAITWFLDRGGVAVVPRKSIHN